MKRQNLKFEVNNVSFEMVAVEGGTFQMGDTYGRGWIDEKPVHSVTLSDYYIGKTVVTQALWEAVMGSNLSYYEITNFPADSLSWYDCQEFIKKLNAATGKTFRLPTEAEWEYAAKGGNKSKGYKYSGSNDINSVAWNTSNSGEELHLVATKLPNELGIYDMSGNVYEWCDDWYGTYNSYAETNPTGAANGAYRVLRGGSYAYSHKHSCVSHRSKYDSTDTDFGMGFRLAL